MDGMERLGYQVSVFLRVPDLDHAEHRHRSQQHTPNRAALARSHTHSGASKSLYKPGGSTPGSGGSGPGPGSGIDAVAPKSPKKTRSHARPRPLSGGSSVGDLFHSGGDGGGSSAVKDAAEPASAPSSYGTPAGAHLHSAMLARAGNGAVLGGVAGAGSAAGAGANSGGTPHRVRLREQGVDELLQLKLHQALAAEDDVPEGATIVLATGDGNVGQFNEEGFLGECAPDRLVHEKRTLGTGPVRTALKRGWKVELYSWQGGLSELLLSSLSLFLRG